MGPRSFEVPPTATELSGCAPWYCRTYCRIADDKLPFSFRSGSIAAMTFETVVPRAFAISRQIDHLRSGCRMAGEE
jgi:hypothetical protein